MGLAPVHGHLWKVRVMLKVDPVTELYRDSKENRAFREGCPAALFGRYGN